MVQTGNTTNFQAAEHMTQEQFIWWLHGFMEISQGRVPTEQEWVIIQDHLNMFFNKITPSYDYTQPITMPDYGSGITNVPYIYPDPQPNPNLGTFIC